MALRQKVSRNKKGTISAKGVQTPKSKKKAKKGRNPFAKGVNPFASKGVGGQTSASGKKTV